MRYGARIEIANEMLREWLALPDEIDIAYVIGGVKPRTFEVWLYADEPTAFQLPPMPDPFDTPPLCEATYQRIEGHITKVLDE